MNLIEGLHEEMNRVREIITEYDSIPRNAGKLASSLMKLSISEAEKAISSGDVIAMMTAYNDLTEYQW